MKSIFSCIIILVIFFSGQSFAGNSDLFTYDKAALSQEFSEVNTLEAILLSSDYSSMDVKSLTPELALVYTRLQTQAPLSLAGINAVNFDFPSFLMGLCCCPVGVFTIAFDDDSTKEDRNSFGIGAIGFVVGGGCLYLSWVYYTATNVVY